jgi:hypothetical protein
MARELGSSSSQLLDISRLGQLSMVDLREHCYEPSGFIKTELPSQLCNCQHFKEDLYLFNQVRYSRYSVFVMYVWGRQTVDARTWEIVASTSCDYPRPQPHEKSVDIS